MCSAIRRSWAAKYMNDEQRADTQLVFAGIDSGRICSTSSRAWYVKAARLHSSADGRRCACAFVSTNSITQGEQVGVLWGWLLAQGMFTSTSRTAPSSGATRRGAIAAVHCVIVGLRADDRVGEMPALRVRRHRSVSLTHDRACATSIPTWSTRRTVVARQAHRLRSARPRDGLWQQADATMATLSLSTRRAASLVQPSQQPAPWLRRYIGADEFINGVERWCLWLGVCAAGDLRALPRCR